MQSNRIAKNKKLHWDRGWILTDKHQKRLVLSSETNLIPRVICLIFILEEGESNIFRRPEKKVEVKQKLMLLIKLGLLKWVGKRIRI